MSFFYRITAYIKRGFQIISQRGVRAAFHALYAKLQIRVRRPPSDQTIRDWLAYYLGRVEHPRPLNVDSKKYPKVSIIILTYNNLLINELCLRSLYCNTTYPNFEVIVVDNASTDKTPKWLKQYAKTHPNLKLILNKENLGFAGGNNQAANEADGEYLIFLNNDTVVTQGWVERFLTYLQADSSIGLIGPVTNATGNEALIPVIYSTPEDMEAFALERASTMSGHSFNIRMLAFYCVMVRKNHYITLGGLDERYSTGMFEDDDLAVRYLQQGLRVVCAEDVFIHHFQGASFGKLNHAKYQEIFEENRKKYEQKWGRAWEPYQIRQALFSYSTETEASFPIKIMGKLNYRCNICGRNCASLIEDLGRETPSCVCGSTVRSRSIIHILSMELFGHSMALPDFPVRPDLHGWGMSDAGYVDLLSQKIGYVNTYYDREPRFDITEPLGASVVGSLDFLISTEVFEHITPPVSRAFENARKLLKPSGILILTVPYTLNDNTQEHFPELNEYELIQEHDHTFILRNVTQTGKVQVFKNLVFHGGVGSTLEMRVFSRNGLLAELENAGFRSVKIFSDPYLEFGIYWHQSWSLPIVARTV